MFLTAQRLLFIHSNPAAAAGTVIVRSLTVPTESETRWPASGRRREFFYLSTGTPCCSEAFGVALGRPSLTYDYVTTGNTSYRGLVARHCQLEGTAWLLPNRRRGGAAPSRVLGCGQQRAFDLFVSIARA